MHETEARRGTEAPRAPLPADEAAPRPGPAPRGKVTTDRRDARTRSGNAFLVLHRNRRLLGLGYRGFVIVGVLSLLCGLGQAFVLVLIAQLVTTLSASGDLVDLPLGPLSADSLSSGQLIGIGVALVFALAVVELVLSYAVANFTTAVLSTSGKGLLRRYSHATYEAQGVRTRGDTNAVLLTLTSQAYATAGTLGAGLTALGNFVVLVVGAVAFSPIAAFAVLVGFSIMLGMLRPMMRLTRRMAALKTKTQRALGAQVFERLEVTRDVRSFGVEDEADRPIAAAFDQLAARERKLRVASRMSSTGYRLGALLLVLAMLALVEGADPEALTALTAALLMLLRSLSYGQALQAAHQSIVESAPVVEQIVEEATRLEAAAEPQSGTVPSAGVIGRVRLRDVGFAYHPGRPVLHDVTLEIPPRAFVALIGPSGAGKSTIMNLLLRQRVPTTGTIEADGTPIDEIPVDWWRARTAHVPQEPLLQSGTVEEAIRFHRPGITAEAIRAAARRAHIADEIEAMPAGYETEVGQLGANLSGGQRQRVALARALAGDPDLLLLDEPTSALDPTSERLIAATLDDIRSEMTIVVIAHRERTVEHASHVILVRDGTAVAASEGDQAMISRFLGTQDVTRASS